MISVLLYPDCFAQNLQDGSVTTSESTESVQSIGNAPNNTTQDWAVLVYDASKFDPVHATSAEELTTNTTKVGVYPNPFTNTLILNDVPDNASVKLFSISGQQINLSDIQMPTMGDNYTLGTEKLHPGMYILKVNNQSYKLIKLNE